MKFLIDENLPASLLTVLGENGTHATALGARMTDDELWTFARENEYVIVTKDADYFDRLTLNGAPPKVVWIRTRNLRLAEQRAHLLQSWPTVRELLEAIELVEVHHDRVEGVRFR